MNNYFQSDVINFKKTDKPWVSIFLITIYIFCQTIKNPFIISEEISVILYSIIFFIYMIFIFRSLGKFLFYINNIALPVHFWVALYIYFALSILWADASVTTFLKAAGILAMCIATFGFVSCTGRYIFPTVYISLSLIVAIGILVSIFIPSIGQHSEFIIEDKWCGLAGHKNSFGFHGALLSLFAIVYLFRRGKWPNRVYHLTSATIGVIAVISSGSRGAMSMLILLTFILIISTLNIKKNQKKALVFICVYLLSFLLFILSVFFTDIDDKYFKIMDYEVNTSGRIYIWKYAISQTSNWLVGCGIDGFWDNVKEGEFWRAVGWQVPNFHNGYVATFVEGGVVGLALLSIVVALFLLLSIKLILIKSKNEEDFLIIFFVGFIIRNLFEDNVVRSTDLLVVLTSVCLFYWALYVKPGYRAINVIYIQQMPPIYSEELKYVEDIKHYKDDGFVKTPGWQIRSK